MSLIHKKMNGGIEGLTKRIMKLKGSIAVGVFDTLKYPNSGVSVLDVAMIHEFGSAKRGIPKRSFIRSTADKNKDIIKNKLKEITKKVVVDGADGSKLRGQTGVWFANEIKKTIRAGGVPFAANKKQTIKRKKGNNTPLRDSGLLMKSISWQEL